MEITFKPIGIIHTTASNDYVKENGDQEGELEIFPEFADGLDGIDGYSHLFVLVYFDRLRPEQIGPLKVKPRGLLRCGFKLDDLPELGVFALDSPTRPNPIGLTLVRILRRNGSRIVVRGLDFFDATPILDIKGHRAAVSYCQLRFARMVSQVGRSDGSCLSLLRCFLNFDKPTTGLFAFLMIRGS